MDDNNENNKEVILTDNQKLIILEMLNADPDHPPKVKDIIEKVFGKKIDAREMPGIAVRKFISEQGLKYTGARTNIPAKVIVLTEEQKEFIVNNVRSMKPLELGRVLFKNENLTNLDIEVREIYKFLKTLPNNITNSSVKSEELNISDYEPPKTEDQTIKRVNKYVSNAGLIKEKLTEKQKRDIKNLIGYLHTTRLLSQINTYSSAIDRELFESEFIRCTYDKALTEEEVDQYIIYATEVVSGRQIAKRIEMFERDQDANREGDGKLTMTLVELVNTLRQDLNQCITRQRALLKALQGERKERLNAQLEDNTSILDLLSYWKDYERRQHLLKLAGIRDEKLKDEIERLKSLPDIITEIFGISQKELLGE